tara:strand:+ start:703 stop:1473 length:771 start_codon:yes stop_codon:yes gene_type:complete
MAEEDIADDYNIWTSEDIITEEQVQMRDEDLAELAESIKQAKLKQKNAAKAASLWQDQPTSTDPATPGTAEEDELPAADIFNIVLDDSEDAPSLKDIIAMLPFPVKDEDIINCVEFSALSWTSYAKAAEQLTDVFGGSWMDPDLTDEAGANLFPQPVIVIRDIGQVSSIPIEAFMRLYYTSKVLAKQIFEDRVMEYIEKQNSSGQQISEEYLESLTPASTGLVLVNYPLNVFSYAFGEDEVPVPLLSLPLETETNE